MSDLLAAVAVQRAAPAPPVRIVHLGLGAFSRSHLAWYTQHASDRADWGISAYTGRSRGLADRLAAQDGVYTLVSRDDEGDRSELIESVVDAHAGDDVAALVADIAAPATAIITLTVTEVGYRLDAAGRPDGADPVVRADTDVLRAVFAGAVVPADASPSSALGRVLLGLEARRRAGGGALAIVSCDNLSDNGGRVQRALHAWSHMLSAQLAEWIGRHVQFVSSSVDRITPGLDAVDAASLERQYGDSAPVVAEPFSDWVISGRFPAGRPDWESAGARFVDDLEAWEARKLWLLNGAHTLLACLGLVRGHRTVAEAIADPFCARAVDDLWDEAERHLPAGLGIEGYRTALLQRFRNSRIAHRLTQIASDSAAKLSLRVIPVLQRERAAGRMPKGGVRTLAAWVEASEAGLISTGARATEEGDATEQLLRRLGSGIADDRPLVRAVDRDRGLLSGN